jgi:RHS repeat-associated protein
VANFANYTYDSNGNMVSDDTRGNDLSGSLQGAGGIGGLLARSDNTQLLLTQDSTLATACYHSDGNGNVTCLIYTNQFIAAKYLYDPYGNILSMYGPLAEANLYRFSSKEYHPNSGLVYYLYRFYDPNLQRWLNRDLLGGLGFDRGGIWFWSQMPTEIFRNPNLFTFSKNAVPNVVDPHGLIWIEILEPATTLNGGGLWGGCNLRSNRISAWAPFGQGPPTRICTYSCAMGYADMVSRSATVIVPADMDCSCPSAESVAKSYGYSPPGTSPPPSTKH